MALCSLPLLGFVSSLRSYGRMSEGLRRACRCRLTDEAARYRMQRHGQDTQPAGEVSARRGESTRSKASRRIRPQVRGALQFTNNKR